MSYVCFTQKITLINCFAYIFCILFRWILSLLSLRFICTATKLPPAVMLFPLMDVQLHPGCVTQAGLVVEYVLYIFSWFWWLNRAFFKNLISEKLWHFDLQKQTRCQTRSNQRCKLTSKIGLTGPTPNKESQVELICAALNHISLKEPHTHISTQQMADCFSVLCEIRHDCGRFSPEGHISCTQEAYVLWFYNMGENKPGLRKCSTLANAETLEDIERAVLLTVPASLRTAFKYNKGVGYSVSADVISLWLVRKQLQRGVWIYQVWILKFYSKYSQVLSFSTSIDRI